MSQEREEEAGHEVGDFDETLDTMDDMPASLVPRLAAYASSTEARSGSSDPDDAAESQGNEEDDHETHNSVTAYEADATAGDSEERTREEDGEGEEEIDGVDLHDVESELDDSDGVESITHGLCLRDANPFLSFFFFLRF